MTQHSELLWYALWITLAAVAALAIAVVVSRIVRKRLEPPPRSPSFTLQDLREMRDAGQLTGAEYEAMRAAIIGQARADRPGEPSAGDRRGPHGNEPYLPDDHQPG